MVSGLLLASPVIRNLANRYGIRPVIMYALNPTAVSMLMLYAIGDPRPTGLLFWITASLGGVTVDVVGDIRYQLKPPCLGVRTKRTLI